MLLALVATVQNCTPVEGWGDWHGWKGWLLPGKDHGTSTSVPLLLELPALLPQETHCPATSFEYLVR